ncbi:MAG: glycosyltransferase family 4 protein [Candidatus Moranbacteria bacterium]|nr:glycosyltransferase family 4 protein [Candidatus Moranbacteria bacterium]
MRIAIFTNNYLPNPFGVSGSIESFRKQLEEAGHTVYVFAPSFKGYVDENENVFRYPAIDLKFRGIRFPVVIPRSFNIDKILSGLEIDIIHSQHPNLLGWEARRWAKKKNVPLVFTWHTLYDQYAHFFPLVPRRLAAWWTIGNARKYADRADQVIVPTASVKKIIEKWGVENKNLEVIPTGVDEKQLTNPSREVVRKKYSIATDEILLTVITRLTKEKNLEFLLEAVAQVLKENQKVKFMVVGDGDLMENLKDITIKNNVSTQVIFSGFIPNEIKKDYYAAGDIFVFASKSETQGMIISEAMYLGLPVVAVGGPGIQDMVESGETGILVKEDKDEFCQAVLKLVGNPDLRKKYAQNGEKSVKEKYVSQVCTKSLLAVYEKAILENKERKEAKAL